MRFFLHTALLAAAIFLLSLNTGNAQFRNGGNWLGPSVTLTKPAGFGLNFEHGVSNNDIGTGALVRYYSGSSTKSSLSFLLLQFQTAYHFMPGNQFDPFAGGRLGLGIGESDNDGRIDSVAGFILSVYGGFRYFLTPGFSCNGTIEGWIDKSEIQILFGVDFTL